MNTERNSQSVNDSASEWFVRIQDEELDYTEKLEFQRWMNEDESHVEAYEKLESVWLGLDQLQLTSNKSTLKQSNRTPIYAIAASFIFVAILISFFAHSLGYFSEYQTLVGEQRIIPLEDSSSITLNTDSAVSVRYSSDLRRIKQFRGEAYFEVMTDKSRPFIVDTKSGQINVLGTAFLVKQTSDYTRVTVTKNSVSVSDDQKGTLILSAGESVRITEKGLEQKKSVNINSSLNWVKGRIGFDNQPLSDVLAELDRYQPGKIIIMDSGLEDIPVTGLFSLNNLDNALNSIEESFPVYFKKHTKWVTLVYSNEK